MKALQLALPVALFSAACGDVKVAMDDINDINVDGAQFAIFADAVGPLDGDFDGIPDFELSNLTVLISDQEDLCAQLEADPEAIDKLADLQGISLLAAKVEALGQASGFAGGDELAGNAGLLDLLFQPAEGQIGLLSAVAIRAGGADLVQAFDDGLAAAGDAQLSIDRLTPGEELAFSFTSTLTTENADATRFDTDSDGDGVNDVQTISAALEIKVRSATFCAALLQ